jgi:hypothetical protein
MQAVAALADQHLALAVGHAAVTVVQAVAQEQMVQAAETVYRPTTLLRVAAVAAQVRT